MSNGRKNERLEIRLTPEEKRKIAYNAKLMGITKTEYISLCVRRRRIVVCEDFPKLIFHLSKIGNNINQIAAVANTNKTISQSSIDEVRNLMTDCYGRLSEFMSFITEPEKGFDNANDKVPELLEAVFQRLASIEKKLDEKNRI